MSRLINYVPQGGTRVLYAVIPLLLLLLLYVLGSEARHHENPRDKIMPPIAKMVESTAQMAVPDTRTGRTPLFEDTAASLKRLGWALLTSTILALVLGIALGLLPIFGASLGPMVSVISAIPPVAVLPILFILLGLGETAKIALIVVGTAPVMIRDLALRVRTIPTEQIVKAQTLGASTWQIITRVALPQALPQLLDTLRLSLCAAWVYLISAEAIAADVGLGYRIFLVRRYLSMDVILPYVLLITILAVSMDLLLKSLRHHAFPWARSDKAGG